MAKSYSVRRIVKNPPLTKFVLPVQKAIPQFDGDDTIETYYSLSHPSFMENIDRFTAHHEIKIDRPGRANGKPFTYYYEPHDFPFYHDKIRNLLYICTKKDVVKSFITRLQLAKDWEPIKVDYSAMLPILPTITGAWFCELKLKYVRSAGYFGQHVNKSDEYKKAAESGQISVLYVDIPLLGKEYRVGITREGAIILSQNYELIEEEIEVIKYVFDKFLAPMQVV